MELWLHAQLLYLRIHFSHLRPVVQSSVSCGQSGVCTGSPADQALNLDSASSPVLLWGNSRSSLIESFLVCIMETACLYIPRG